MYYKDTNLTGTCAPVEDNDGDGTPDCNDGCPSDPDKIDPGECGCGYADTNGDGYPDCEDIEQGDEECDGRCCEVDNSLQADPIRIYNGNSIQNDTDITLPSPYIQGLSFKRYYNSRSFRNTPMGFGWTHTYDITLRTISLDTENGIKILDHTGRGIYFVENGSVYEGLYKELSYIEPVSDQYLWYRTDGSVYTFDSDGLLVETSDANGNRQLLTYDTDSLLEIVTDEATGRTLAFYYDDQSRIEYITGPVTSAVSDGIWVSFGYDNNDNLTTVSYPDGSGYTYLYEDGNDVHNMTGKIDAESHAITQWAYDTEDRAVSSTNRDGKNVTIDYTDPDNVAVTDGYGTLRTYGIDEFAGRKKVTSATGIGGCASCGSDVVRYEYDTDRNLTEKEYQNGRIDTFSDHDSRGNPGTIVRALGTSDEYTRVLTYHPDLDTPFTRTEASVLGAGNKVTTWDYDDDGDTVSNENPTLLVHRRIETGYTKDTSGTVVPYEYITTYEYNSNGRLTSVDGPRSGSDDTVSYTYDETTGNLLTVTLPITGTVSYSQYDAAGQPGLVTDVNGNSTQLAYDGRGRIVSKTSLADGSVTTYEYTLSGDIGRITNPNGITLDYEYDAQYGRLTRVVDSLGDYITYDYDDQGNRTEISYLSPEDERQFWKRFDYHGPEKPGKLWKEINADDTYTEYGYDESGHLTSTTDANDLVTSYGYDIFNRTETVTQPGDRVTEYGYDTDDNLVSVTDAEGHVTTYLYDDAGRVVAESSPDAGNSRFTYDAAGNLVSKTDANGVVTTYTYDAAGRLTEMVFPDAAQNVVYAYDDGENGMGMLTGIDGAYGNTSYQYNHSGLLVSEETTIDGLAYTTGYSYDTAGLLTGITYPDGSSISYGRDAAGNVVSVDMTRNGVTAALLGDIAYQPFGPMAYGTYGNGMALSRTYDEDFQLTALQVGSYMDLSYGLDDVGNILTITDQLDETKSQSFGYDETYGLLSASGIYGDISYTYDNVGNRLTRTVDGLTDTYTYETGTSRLSGITGENPASYAYDAVGNTVGADGRTLAYNQLNRLVEVSEDGSVTATYTYDALGRRVKKTSLGVETVYHYDQSGNLIGESDADGDFSRLYYYLGDMRLAAVDTAPGEMSVQVTTSQGDVVAGVKVYAFTEGGSYTGISAETDEDGLALFDETSFDEGVYQFRIDYLGCKFWSDTVSVPGAGVVPVSIESRTATVSVVQDGNSVAGVKVYLFSEAGSYLGLYGVSDEDGVVTFDLPVGYSFKFRADVLGGKFFSETAEILAEDVNYITVDTGGGTLTLTVDDGDSSPLTGIKLYLFNSGGSYLGLSGTTDSLGAATFDVPGGTYKVRADYLGYQFWSAEITVDADLAETLSIAHQEVAISVQEDNNGDVIDLQGLKVYLFSGLGSYLGQYETTDDLGQVVFTLPEQEYKIRVDYLGGRYWSDVFNWTDETVVIEAGIAALTVTQMDLPLSDVKVYVFSSTGSYLGLSGTSDENGQEGFRLPEGDYMFRADYLGTQYWSGLSTILPHVENPVTVSTGGGSFALTVLKDATTPLEGIKCYLFSESGSYLGMSDITSSEGTADFNLADGTYMIRVDYFGNQYWSDMFSIPDENAMEFTIAHQDVTISVERDFWGDILPGEGLKTYLFTPAGSYLGLSTESDSQGQVTFNLPLEEYMVRADYLSEKYWSDIFLGTDETIVIEEGLADVQVAQGDTLLENVSVYVFNESASYLGMKASTSEEGIAEFRLPEGTYKFRADYQGGKFWATEPIVAHQDNIVDINTGGGEVTVTVEKAADDPLVDVPVYVFTGTGAYIGLNQQTSEEGVVSFDLSDGDFMFRADYLGYKFWSDTITVPAILSEAITIAHQDITVTVESTYPDTTPLEGVRTYLFTESGSYQGQTADTDGLGQAVYSLPAESYQIRADYLGYQFWSDAFTQTDSEISIPHGRAVLQVIQNGQPVTDAPVYLFKASGSYLGRVTRTDENGEAVFDLPEQAYKFRIDYNGVQHWSDEITLVPGEETVIELDLDLLLSDLTNNPNPDRFDGTPPEYKKEVLVASIGSMTGLLSQMVVAQIPGESESIYYFINDHLGTPQQVVDEDGNVVWQADYSPFGDVTVGSSTADYNFRFAGQYYDSETGLHYNWNRYYDPGLGRYLRADPIGLYGGINLYSYVQNNPVNFIDPDGLEIRVYSSDAFGRPGLNHAFVYSTETGRGKGTAGSSGKTRDNGVRDLTSPYNIVSLPTGMSEDDFMDAIEAADGWNNWVWTPYANDCHSDLENAFEQTGVSYPGAPNGRIDIDDEIKSGFNRILNQLNNPRFVYRLFGGH